jgi:hypothetical protein
MGEVDRLYGVHGEKRNACNIFVRKPQGRSPFWRPRCWCVNNIKMDHGEVFTNIVMNLQIP